MQNSEKSAQAQTICVLLFESFSNHCLANAIEPFRAANTIARQSLYSWKHISLDGGTIKSSSGLPVETLSWTEAMPSGDYFIIMPSYGFSEYATPRTSEILRTARNRFSTLVGMDTGAWLLAKAGLLDGRRATIHWDEFTRFSETFPNVDAAENRFIIEPDMATCGGASTAFELTLELIKIHHSPMFALEIAALFMHGDKLEMHDPFQRLSSDTLVRSATALMRRTIENPLTIPAIAKRLGVEQRTLEDHFQHEMRLTPSFVYRSIRLREARRLVELTTMNIAEIAERCGYQNTSAMTRAYRIEFGQPPRIHRQSFRFP
ncbi:MAG: GlxA family transcriptional regulator [Pseudomonadota bacterium]